jgi:hypothetical protein
MKRILWFIAGLVAIWFADRKYKLDQKQLWREIGYLNKDVVHLIRRVEVDLADSLNETQDWQSADGWVNLENVVRMKVLGVYDKVLTNEQLQRIHKMSVEEIENSFDITQEIRVTK